MLLSIALLVLAAAPLEDARSALAHLASDFGSERAAAERWLAANLEPEDLPLVAETASRANIEVRTRLVRALSCDDRHFELAVLLLTDREPGLRRIGHDALGEMAVRWWGAGGLEPRRYDEVERKLRRRFLGRFSIRPFERDLDELIDTLARHAPPMLAAEVEGGALAIAVDPRMYTEALDATSASNTIPAGGETVVLEGSFETVLASAVKKRGARLDVFGLGGAHPWMRVAQLADSGTDTALELVERWCIDVLQYPDRPRGAGSARALAACGWPAPLAWLEKHFRTSADENALAGLLLAAGRGRVSASLMTAASVEKLLQPLGAPASGDAGLVRRRDLTARAFAHLPAIGVDGSDLNAAVERATSGGGDAQRALGARILAGMGRASNAWRERAKRDLASADASDDTRIALLRALASTQSGAEKAWTLAASEAMLADVEHEGAGPQFLAAVERVSALPPNNWRDSAVIAAFADDERLLAILWWSVSEGGIDVAARLALDWLTARKSATALGDRLADRARIGDGARVERWLARAGELGGADKKRELQRVALLAGVIDRASADGVVLQMLANKPVRADDWAVLGAACGCELDDATLDKVLDALLAEARSGAAASKSVTEPWVDACERACVGLLERGALEQDLASSFDALDALRPQQGAHADLTRTYVKFLERLAPLLSVPGHPLASAMRDGAWPPKPGPPPLSLEALDP